MTSKNRKTFIIDTSVLLYDKESIHAFNNHDVVIPLIVLDELDRFKDKKGLVGENARYVNRFLDSLREKGSLHLGVILENKQKISVYVKNTRPLPVDLDISSGDNKIISAALDIRKDTDKKIVIVTKDINLRVKCDALGIVSEDYYKDHVDAADGFYDGLQIIDTDSVTIDHLYEDVYEKPSDNVDVSELCENEFVCFKSDSQSFLGIHKNGSILKCKQKKSVYELTGVEPRSLEQLCALNLILDDDIPLVTLCGRAGSGKTFLTLLAGLEGLLSDKYNKIVITRNIIPVGKDIGFLPGDMNEKMAPWMAPIIDNFRQGFKDKDLSYFNSMRERGQIEIAPLSFMRGRTFSDTFFIFDEAQNATIHEIKTVVTRIGENSKIVLLGDTDQIDTPYIDSRSNGLRIISEKLKDQALAGHITLKKGERSELATLASKIL